MAERVVNPNIGLYQETTTGMYYFKTSGSGDAAAEMLKALNPTLVAPVNGNVAVAANASTAIRVANANRDSLIISVPADAAGPVWFEAGVPAVIGEGMIVNPGGVLVLGIRAALHTTTTINAISADAVVLGYTEVSRA